MFWFGRALQVITFSLEVCVLLLMRRRQLHRKFPLFATYIAYVALETMLRSVFGTRFEFLSRMLPGVAYILALVVWLSAATHSLPERVQLSGERVSPEAVISGVRRQLLLIRSFLRKG